MRGCLIQLPYFRDELTMKSKKIKKPAQVPKGTRGTSTLCFSVLLTSGLSHPPTSPPVFSTWLTLELGTDSLWGSLPYSDFYHC